jgi:hypothetical protein
MLDEARYQEIYDLARRYLGFGFCIVPIVPGSKWTPKGFSWRRYNSLEARTDEKDIERWFHPTHGIYRGFSLGQISGLPSGVVAVDCDTPEAVAWVEANLPPTPFRVASGRSPEAAKNGIGHRFYRWSEAAIKEFAYEDTKRPGKLWLKSCNGAHIPGKDDKHIELGLDLKIDGSLTVLPGAIHKSGRHYQLADGACAMHTSELPTFDPSLLEKRLCGCGVRASKRGCRGGGIWKERKRREDSRPASERALLKRSEQQALSGISPIKLSSDQYVAARDLATVYMNRAHTVGAGKRDITAFRHAATLVRDYAMSQRDAYALLSRWNSRCPTPLGEGVLREKVNSAFRSGRNPFGKALYALGIVSAEEYGLLEGEDATRPKVPEFVAEQAQDVMERHGIKAQNPEQPLTRSVESYTHAEKRALYDFARRQFDERAPEFRRVSRVSSCGRANIAMACSKNEAHSDVSMHHVVCEVDKACPYCASRRASVIAQKIIKNWDVEVDVYIVDLDKCRHDLSFAPAEAHAAVRRAMRRAMPKGATYRWVCGHKHQVWLVAREDEVKLDRIDDSILRNMDVVTAPSTDEVAAIIRRTWTQPAYYLQKLLRSGDWVATLDSPYLSSMDSRFPRSRGSRGGVAEMPWPSIVSLREELSRQAKEKRGGVDHRHCAHELEDGTRCRAARSATVYDGSTGEILFEELSADVPLWRTHHKAVTCVTALVGQERFGLTFPQDE